MPRIFPPWAALAGVVALSAAILLIHRGRTSATGTGLEDASEANPTTAPLSASTPKDAPPAKWLIVRPTTSNPKKSRWMEETTWKDSRVIEWLNRRAVVAPVDIEKDTVGARTLSLDISDAAIAYKDDIEFDRVSGYQSPTELLEWLTGLDQGEKSVEFFAREPTFSEADVANLRTQLEVARKLTETGFPSTAAAECVRLWQSSRSSGLGSHGIRVFDLTKRIRLLCSSHPETKSQFLQLRQQVDNRLKAPKVCQGDVFDFLLLNDAMGDRKSTLDWFERLKNDRRRRCLLRMGANRIEPLLIAQGRWSELLVLHEEPMELIEHERQAWRTLVEAPAPPGYTEAQLKFATDSFIKWSRETIGRMYAALLASGQEEIASAFAARVRDRFSPIEEMNSAMVRLALQAGQSRIEHLDWISHDPQSADIVALRRVVRDSLRRHRDAQLRIIW
jgi:hypothetical protein